jgi:HlyD family secretion protein
MASSRFIAAAFGAVLILAAAAVGAAEVRYRTAPVERGPLVATVSASGALNAVVLVEVGSQISGQIKELLADFNSPVREGALIARIDPATYEAKVAQARADLRFAEAAVVVQQRQIERSRADLRNLEAELAAARAQVSRAELALDDARKDYDRKKPLVERQVISASDWDKTQNAWRSAQAQLAATQAQQAGQEAQIASAEAALRMAEAQVDSLEAQVAQKQAALRQAEIDLDHTEIRAPVDGVVVSRNVNIGQTVAASLQAPTLFTIAQDLKVMQVDGAVAEADVGRVRPGQKASFTVDAYPGRSFAGEVVQVRKAPQIQQNVVTYDVVVSAANPGEELLPGMTANLSILVASRTDARKVPNAALRFRPPAGTAAPSEPAPLAALEDDSGASLPGRVYVLGEDGRPVQVPVRVGISDGASTEIVAGALRDGQAVIVGGGPAPAAPSSGFPRLF